MRRLMPTLAVHLALFAVACQSDKNAIGYDELAQDHSVGETESEDEAEK